MRQGTCNTVSISLAILLGLALLLSAGTTQAKKPAPPPPAPSAEGWLYSYVEAGLNGEGYPDELWRTDAATGESVKLGLALPDWTESGTTHKAYALTHDAHGGDYWVVHFRAGSGVYPDGLPVREIWASRTDGSATVKLVADTSIQFAIQACVAVAPDDDRIAFNCIDTYTTDGQGNTVPASAGVYEVDVTWNNGVPSAGTARTFIAPIAFSIAETGVGDLFAAPLLDLAWSGDGTQLVAGCWSAATDQILVTVITPSPTGAVQDVLREGMIPRWSATTDQILFVDGAMWEYGISSIASDGTDYEVLVAPTSSRKSTTYTGAAAWTEDGTQFAFALNTSTRNGVTKTYAFYDLSTGDVTGTESAVPGEGPLAWRPTLSD